MPNSENPIEPIKDLIASIRRNAPMYLGGTDFFGLIQYLVSAFDLMLDCDATWIEIEVGNEIRLASDALLPLQINAEGLFEQLEMYGILKPRRLPDATIITALSDSLNATITDGKQETHLHYESGKRLFMNQVSAPNSPPAVELTFSPDTYIFSVCEVSPAVLHSYCRRISCLHPGVTLRIKAAGQVTEYRSEQGIRDFFDAVSLPYQILHKPIHILEEDNDLKVETVFVFQSWTDNRIWSFANKGRVPDGGTHEAGLLDAVAKLHHTSVSSASTGILAVLAIEYPHIAFEGCIKARIGNPELREKVSALVTRGLKKWAEENEEELDYLETIERFQFAVSW